jgi:small conductance mechanosensitive channel
MIGGAQLESFVDWVTRNQLLILAGAVGLLLVFRYARPLVRRLTRRLITTRSDGPDGQLHAEEVEKRVTSIEELMVRLVRLVIVGTLVLLALTVLDLLPVLAGLSVVAAAVTLAGQSIVLDYLMGVLILLEGQYYRGDWIAIGDVEGTVEDVGLRRTVIRDNAGTVHSVSNGLIRSSSNLTRVYAGLVVDIVIKAAADVERAIALVDVVGGQLTTDPDWAERILEPPHFTRIVDMRDTGVTLRVVGRVRANDRWSVPGELRRRLLVALTEAGIAL